MENQVSKEAVAEQVNTPVNVPAIEDKSGVHKTSIEATKGSLVPLRPTKATLAGWHIEAVHICMFFGLLVFLFIGMWVKGKKTNF